MNQRFPDENPGTTHYEGCWRHHPACAYEMGRRDAGREVPADAMEAARETVSEALEAMSRKDGLSDHDKLERIAVSVALLVAVRERQAERAGYERGCREQHRRTGSWRWRSFISP